MSDYSRGTSTGSPVLYTRAAFSLALLVLHLAGVLLLQNTLKNFLWLAALFIAATASAALMRSLKAALLRTLLISVVFSLINFFSVTTGKIIFEWSFIIITMDGIYAAMRTLLLLMSMWLAAMSFTARYGLHTVSIALGWVFLPLKPFGINPALPARIFLDIVCGYDVYIKKATVFIRDLIRGKSDADQVDFEPLAYPHYGREHYAAEWYIPSMLVLHAVILAMLV